MMGELMDLEGRRDADYRNSHGHPANPTYWSNAITNKKHAIIDAVGSDMSVWQITKATLEARITNEEIGDYWSDAGNKTADVGKKVAGEVLAVGTTGSKVPWEDAGQVAEGFAEGWKAGDLNVKQKLALPLAYLGIISASDYQDLLDARNKAWDDAGLSGTGTETASNAFAWIGTLALYAAGGLKLAQVLGITNLGGATSLGEAWKIANNDAQAFYFTGSPRGWDVARHSEYRCPAGSGGRSQQQRRCSKRIYDR